MWPRCRLLCPQHVCAADNMLRWPGRGLFFRGVAVFSLHYNPVCQLFWFLPFKSAFSTITRSSNLKEQRKSVFSILGPRAAQRCVRVKCPGAAVARGGANGASAGTHLAEVRGSPVRPPAPSTPLYLHTIYTLSTQYLQYLLWTPFTPAVRRPAKKLTFDCGKIC